MACSARQLVASTSAHANTAANSLMMGGEARPRKSPEAREQAPAGHGEAVPVIACASRRSRSARASVRTGTRGRPRTARISAEGCALGAPGRQTRLMQRRRAAAIRRPPVSHQDAVKVGAQHLGRLVEAAPVGDTPFWRGKRPQPVPHRADPPAGLVGAHELPRMCAQRSRSGAATRAARCSTCQTAVPALPQECGHLGEWHADLLVQARNQCDGARPQVDGGPHRVRSAADGDPAAAPALVHCPTAT